MEFIFGDAEAPSTQPLSSTAARSTTRSPRCAELGSPVDGALAVPELGLPRVPTRHDARRGVGTARAIRPIRIRAMAFPPWPSRTRARHLISFDLLPL